MTEAMLTVPAAYAEHFKEAARETRSHFAEAIEEARAACEEHYLQDAQRGLSQAEKLLGSVEEQDGELTIKCDGVEEALAIALKYCAHPIADRVLGGVQSREGAERREALREAMAELEFWLSLGETLGAAAFEAVMA